MNEDDSVDKIDLPHCTSFMLSLTLSHYSHTLP